MTDTHSPVLFLSGAGLPAWIWDEVRELLGAASSVAPRPPAHSDSPLSAYVEAAVDAAPSGAFAIVAHSSGGVVGAEVARLLGGRVSSFLAVSAVIPAGRESFVSAMPVPNRWMLPIVMRLAGTRPPATAVRRGLRGVGDDQAERIVAEFVPESRHLYTDRTGEHVWSGRRGYVVTTEDDELPPGLQHRFTERLGATWTTQLATGHLPMLQDPRATADAIREFLAG